jgi:hypothetical protein
MNPVPNLRIFVVVLFWMSRSDLGDDVYRAPASPVGFSNVIPTSTESHLQ